MLNSIIFFMRLPKQNNKLICCESKEMNILNLASSHYVL